MNKELFKSKFQKDTRHIIELFDNPLWHDSIVFFVNKERDRIRNIIIDNLTLPNCKGLSERGKGFREATTTAKKVLLIHIGENEKEVEAGCNADSHDDGIPPNNKLLGILPNEL